jgi:lipid-A-disaccharide synthase-like uncharacterized protein
MALSEILWLGTGFLAQGCFAARFLIQWIMSERARRSLMPVHFWYFSLLGSILLLSYATHRRDPVIALGQIIGLLIYLRNLKYIHPEWMERVRHTWFWLWVVAVGAAVSIGYLFGGGAQAPVVKIHNFWTTFGFFGQMLFTSRFLAQWWYTERHKQSVMPRSFWYLSLVGSLMLLIYATAMLDPVIMLGQSLGFIIYTRNLILLSRSDKYQTGLSHS